MAIHKKEKTESFESERKYQTLFQNSALAIGLRDTDGTYLDFNDAYSKMLGYTKEELKILDHNTITHPDDFNATTQNMKLVAEGKSDMQRYEKRYIHKDGHIIWAEVCIQPLLSSDGKIDAIIGTVVDITKRKLAEETLRNSEKSLEKQRDAIASLATNEAIISGDIEKSKVIITETASEILDVARVSIWLLSDDKEEMRCIDMFEALTKTHSKGNILKAKDYPRYFKELKENSQITANDAQNDQRTCEFTPGYLIPLDISSMLDSALLGNEGIIGVICIEHIGEIRNWHPYEESFANTLASIFVKTLTIAEQKQTEEEINMLANAMKSINECVSITNTNNNIIFVNQAFLKTYGYTEEEILGKNISILGSDKNPKDIHNEIHSLAKKDLWQGEIINTKKDGSEFPIYLSSASILNSEGKTVAYIGVANDITSRKQTEETLRKAKEKAEEMSRLKTNFLANMSHEIRTPLNGILGMAEIMKSELKNPAQIKYIDIIEKSGNRLLETLNLILSFSKLEAEKADIHYSNVRIDDIIDEVMKYFDTLSKNKNLFLKKIIKNENLVTYIDERFLRHIISNLINNAIKYTSIGGITVTLLKENNNVVIKVEDTGIGIAKDKYEIIFEEFRQESEGHGRNFEGTGLGLSITKRFVELMKGTIEVESEVGVGSTFTIKFPYVKTSQPVSKKIREEKIQKDKQKPIDFKKENISILIVEDDSLNLDYTIEILKEYYNVEPAVNGIEAIDKAKAKIYDIILMDINLGKGMDGIEAVQKIRKLSGYTDTPIIALTAFVLEGDREEFLAGGCTHYLGKPFTKNQLLELLKSITDKK